MVKGKKRNNKRFLSVFVYSALTLLFTIIPSFAGQKVYFYHTDAAGTPVAMTDSGGNVVWRADYKPFGEEQSITGSIENNEKFVGKEKDKETGLYYFGARYMDAGIGRFVSVDPAGITEKDLMNPQRLNRYNYGLNNPYRYIDPDGKFSIEVHRRMTIDNLTSNGFSRKASERVAQGNIYVDRLSNQGANYQHSMKDIGQNRDEAIRMSAQFSRERLLEAGRAIASGDYETGLHILGEGLHTVQDRKHNWITLPGHTRPSEIETDRTPTLQQEIQSQTDTEQYLKDFQSVLKNDLKLSDQRIEKIKKDLEKY